MSEGWNVYRQTSNRVCKVQQSTERPLLGTKFLGPFKSKEDAKRAMCKNLDPEMTDTNKCWGTLPKDACK